MKTTTATDINTLLEKLYQANNELKTLLEEKGKKGSASNNSKGIEKK